MYCRIAVAALLLIAGHETAVNLIANGTSILLSTRAASWLQLSNRTASGCAAAIPLGTVTDPFLKGGGAT